MINAGMMTSATDNWPTPQWLFDQLNEQYSFTLDAAADDENHKCERYFTAKEDGLSQKWWGVVFCNPPYGRHIGKWVKKAYDEAKCGATVVMLLPARTDTAWYHDYCTKGQITFIRGRLKFGTAKNSAPFPSMIVVFGGKNT